MARPVLGVGASVTHETKHATAATTQNTQAKSEFTGLATHSRFSHVRQCFERLDHPHQRKLV